MNKNAAKLLGKNSVQFLGESIENIAVDYVKTGKTLSSGQCRAVMQFPLPNGTREVSASLKELKQDRKKIGLICQISPEGKEQLKGESTRFVFDDFICRDSKMKSVVNSAQKIATTDVNVFIQGESGTGKEILAQAIHNASSRKHKPFVAVNCAAIPNELMQSELFGYEEGSFTGARKGGRQGNSSSHNRGPFFWMKSGTCLWTLKPTSCACCRKETSPGSGAPSPSRWISESLRQPTGTCWNLAPTAISEKIFFTGFPCSASGFLRCGKGQRTFGRSWII